ncbi:hypothetical protein HDE_02890 [Halotydeus destructor]|nr:hypothetical protein HDE_02890 [Halotydeus destructor]
MVHLRDPSIQPNVLRVLKIWQERNIYGKSFVSELIDTLGGGGIGPSISTIVADFKTQSLVNPILEVTQLEAKTKMSCEPVNQELVKSLTLENLNKLKDKDRSENVIHDCDNTIGLLGKCYPGI